MWETQENWVTHQNGQSLCHKYYPQLNTKEDIESGESQLREITRKSTVDKGGCDADLSHYLLHL